jgi:hypothetical protein
MLEVRDRFLNFPIALLQGFTDDHMKCLSDIFDYGVYTMTFSEIRVFESMEEFEENFGYDITKQWIPILMKRGKELYDSFYGTKFVWTCIHIGTWERYYQKDRRKDDLMVLLAFLAFKSIIQTKPWAVVTNEYLLARMAGFETSKDRKPIPEAIRHFMKANSRTRPWLFTELESHFKFKRKPGNQRGIICSFTLCRQDLIFEHEKSKIMNKAKKLNEEKKKDKMKAEERLNQWRKENNLEVPKKHPKKPPPTPKSD